MWKILGNDVRNMTNFTLSLISSPEVIAINQDKGCVQGSQAHAVGGTEVWIKPLSGTFLHLPQVLTSTDGTFGVVLFNGGDIEAPVTLFISPNNNNLGDFYPATLIGAHIRDAYLQEDLGDHFDVFTALVGPRDAKIFVVSPIL